MRRSGGGGGRGGSMYEVGVAGHTVCALCVVLSRIIRSSLLSESYHAVRATCAST